jgi:hypothetical protein
MKSQLQTSPPNVALQTAARLTGRIIRTLPNMKLGFIISYFNDRLAHNVMLSGAL